MLFNSFEYLIFFPVVTVGYFWLPQKARNYWLLAASLFFYGSWEIRYLGLMLATIVLTYLCGIAMQAARNSDYDEKKKKSLAKLSLMLSLIINFGILFFFKYFNFVAQTINALIASQPVALLDVLLPVGISFYTFQAIGYTIDVYRGDIAAEKNIFTYAVFVSFFPQLVAGPIERAGNLLPQFYVKHSFNFERAHEGLVYIGWGFFCKLVIADRLALFVNAVFRDYANQDGYMLAIAAMLFSIQIYCDFSSYSNIAIGSARVLGFDLMRNFNAPYLATSVDDFWSRWHISLTTWFRDYLYIPLGGNRRGNARRVLNIFIVFLVSGLWHGANWSFVVWGAINGAYLVLSNLTGSLREKVCRKLGIDRQGRLHKLYCRVQTFLLISFAFIFFRAENIGEAWQIIGRIFTGLHLQNFRMQTLFGAGVNGANFIVLLAAIAALFIVDTQIQKCDVVKTITAKPLAVRWTLYLLLIVAIAIFGIYGPSYDPAPFIYFQF